jgi:uncharacterized membrane protein
MFRKLLLRPELALFVLLSLFLLPICGLIFQCGCTYLWSGRDIHCNIHAPAPPNCPWCIAPFHNHSLSSLVQMIPFVVIFICSLIAIRIIRLKSRISYLKQLAAGIIGGLLAMLVVAWIYGKIYHYPFFISK